MKRSVDRRVVALLRSYTDALDAWDGRSGGGGVKLMPSMWNEGSYAELDRALKHMRDSEADRVLWWHVSNRYLWTGQRMARVHVRRSTKGPVAVAPAHSEVSVVVSMDGRTAHARLATWDPRVDPVLVQRGVIRIGDLMYGGDHGRVVVPRSLDVREVA